MSTGIIYTVPSLGDKDGIVELLKIVFPKWGQIKNPGDNWSWKHLEGPHPSDITIAKDGEKVVGVIHRLVLSLKVGDSILLSHYGDDVAVHPDYREKGIWKNLKNAADERRSEKIKFTYMATENPIVKENIVKMGFTPFKHSLSHLIKIRDQEAFLKRQQKDNLVTRVGVTALTGVADIKQFFSSPSDEGVDFSIIDVAKFDDRINEFWGKVKDSYGYSLEKNADYLNWKHCRPTISENRIRLAVKGDEVLGFSVLSIRDDEDYRDGSISDLLALPERLDVVNALISDACVYFDHMSVASIFYPVTKGHTYESLAEHSGFFNASSQKSTFFYYAIVDNSISPDYLDSLPPSRVQLNYF